MTDHTTFRQRLDAELRTRDVQKVSAFLIAEDQWSPGTPADPKFAMWMMIAGSQTLKDLHSEARRWLVAHGHAEVAEMVLSRPQDTGKPATGKQKQRQKPDQGNAKTVSPQKKKQH